MPHLLMKLGAAAFVAGLFAFAGTANAAPAAALKELAGVTTPVEKATSRRYRYYPYRRYRYRRPYYGYYNRPYYRYRRPYYGYYYRPYYRYRRPYYGYRYYRRPYYRRYW